MNWNAVVYNTHKWQVVDGNLFQIQTRPLSFTHISPITTQKACVKKNIQCTSTHSGGAMNKKIIATRLATSTVETITTVSFFPPPSPYPSHPHPHQAHGMVNVWQWRAVGNDHGKTKQQRSWQLEYSMTLNLHSRLSLWNTALALWMRNPIRKCCRCGIHGWLSAGVKRFNGLFQIWIIGLGRALIPLPDQ